MLTWHDPSIDCVLLILIAMQEVEQREQGDAAGNHAST